MLDASTRIDVLNLLGDLKQRGLGILFITHDLALGNYISDSAVILRHGRIVERGATAQVFDNPSTRTRRRSSPRSRASTRSGRDAAHRRAGTRSTPTNRRAARRGRGGPLRRARRMTTTR